MADLAIFAAWGIAAAISPGPGGASSTLPYLTKVAHRGLVYSTKAIKLLFVRLSKSAFTVTN